MKKILFPKFKYTGKIKSVPFWVAASLFFISVNVVWQFFLDKLLKFLGIIGIFPSAPLRVDFIILSFISAFLGIQAIQLFRKGQIDTGKRSLQLAILVEAGVILSEFFFVYKKVDEYSFIIESRLLFISITMINLFLLLLIKLRINYNIKVEKILHRVVNTQFKFDS